MAIDVIGVLLLPMLPMVLPLMLMNPLKNHILVTNIPLIPVLLTFLLTFDLNLYWLAGEEIQ